ncbi:hypothetical protein [Natronococcus occultus]|uniref:Uncharacterized protein n=1 Tax=Natronococcus occultus SP4 TaxID=694430 RepID=L0K1T9_9EURY|nr:hypothetical protein [Natronococcus occultus]AGB38520.1 hypothetical protein Natoc_2761 [Natronococcus occultus SP4]
MIGALTVGKKAVTFGYKRFGIPGAVASGGVALAGYVAVRRALRSVSESEDVDAAIDAGTIEDAVANDGVGAVADPDVLDDAIDRDELDSDVEMDDLESSVEGEADAAENEIDDIDEGDDIDDIDEGDDIGDIDEGDDSETGDE